MAIKEIKYSDVEQRAQTIKTYVDEAAEAAKTQANAYTDEQIRNIPAPPAPDIPTALPQKYEAFKVQLVQGNISEGEDPMWSEYHETLWSGSEVLTNSSATTKAHFVTDTVLYWRSPRKYNLLITINGTEKEFVFEGEHSQYGTNWVIWQLKENDVVVAEAECIGAGNGQYYNNTSTVFVYCPDGSSYIGQTMTAARYGKKQYLYSLTNPAAILQYPSETENTRFLTMCKSIATKNAKLKLTLTDNVIEANYANISNELVTTDYVNGDVRARWIGVVADRKPLAVGTYIYEDMKTCIKGILEVEYTDEEATKECVYDKIQGESYTFKIGDFNHDESSAFDYYFNGAILIPFSNAQIQASFTYRPVSGTEKSVQVKSMVNDGQMLPYFDISELFGQAANTVMAIITSNTAVENSDVGGRPVTTISLTSNIQNFTDANDEIMVGSILTLTPSSLPQTYKKKAVTLATSGWFGKSEPLYINTAVETWTNGTMTFGVTTYQGAGFKVIDNNGVEHSPRVSQHFSQYEDSVSLKLGTGTPYFQLYFNAKYNGSTLIYEQGSFAIWLTVNGGNYTNSIVYSNASEIINYTQSYTDADVKVNSEVRFTLDEANGKLAGQFGLKKTIGKEAGKLTFTADTLPTSAISGTLEIGETSTEGAAFVDGIATSVNGGEASSGGTVTSVSVKMNGSVKGTVTTSGTIDLGTVVTDISGKQDKITTDNKLDVSLVNGLAAVATSGSYNDLGDKPTIPSAVTETTVSNWGFTKNAGTVTSVAIKMNGADKGTVTDSGTIDLGTVLTAWDDVGSEAVISIIGKALYPVGAIYMSTANVNPSTFITGTTWVAWGSGRVPVGVDTSDTSFNTVEKTGGEKTHTLTESEMPAHKHTGTESTSLGNTKPQLGAPATVSKETIIADFTRTTEEVVIYESAATTPANNTLTVEHGITAGGGQPHSILQPYITCYMFKRTA